MMTYLGLALLVLVVVGVWSSCRVSAQADVMSAYQRRALMADRPKHLRR